MKTVWVLERFTSIEELNNYLNEYTELAKNADPSMNKESIDAVIDVFRKLVRDYPNGRWQGFEGKTSYREFCYRAKEAIRNHPTYKFRVVKAKIPDDARYWNGYTDYEVNDGVYRYLMATK